MACAALGLLFVSGMARAGGSKAQAAPVASARATAASAKALPHGAMKPVGLGRARAQAQAATRRELVAQTKKAWEAGRGRALSPKEIARLRELVRRGSKATLAEARSQATRGEARVAAALLDATKSLWASEGIAERTGEEDAVKGLVVASVQSALTAAQRASPDRETAVDQARSDLRAVGLALAPEAADWVRGKRPAPPEAWTRALRTKPAASSLP